MIIVRGISFYVNFTPIGHLNTVRRERLNGQVAAAFANSEEALKHYWDSDPIDAEDPRRHVRREVQNLMSTIDGANTYWTPLGAMRLLISNLERASVRLERMSAH